MPVSDPQVTHEVYDVIGADPVPEAFYLKDFYINYRMTILSGETDPNKLYDQVAKMEEYQVYSDDQIKFKSTAKAFCRTYGFLGAILPYGNADWERLSDLVFNLTYNKEGRPYEAPQREHRERDAEIYGLTQHEGLMVAEETPTYSK